MWKKFRLLAIGVGLLLTVILTSCQVLMTETPVENAVETLVQQTLASNPTSTAEGQENGEETQPSPTPTPQATPTMTPTSTDSSDTSSNSNSDNLCNQARFVEDVSVEDRTTFDPNEPFTKIWRLENMGECTWNTDYQIVFESGYDLGAKRSKDLPQNVEPGETVDIHLSMYAPASPGIFTGYWMLQDEDGDSFGVGEDAEAAFWVRIRVTEEDESIVYNFANNICEAGWESSVEEDIPCPSSENLEQGFVQQVNMPRLEDGAIYDEPTILAYPDAGEGGYMVGRYPYIEIERGDHFRATIGCQSGAQDCDVSYTLRIAQPGEGFTRLGRWHEIYEGLYYPIDIDLSEYAGEEISIVLSTIAVDDSGDNYALWLDPRIVREIETPAPTRTPQPQEVCNAAAFIEDVTVEDRSLFNPNDSFTKIWRLRNVGNCSWTTDYQVVFVSGYQMGAPAQVNLTELIPPGETIDIRLDMFAPDSPGTHTGYWMLEDEDGNVFGVGDDADAPFWVRIRVTEEDENNVYNLATNICQAGWESSTTEEIACPSAEHFEDGFVQWVDNPRLEDGNVQDQPAILTYPDRGRGGYMVGRFPYLTIEEGDHFKATIGCQYDSDGCNVRYTLRILRSGEGFDRLGSWREVYDGLYYPIDVDLSDFAGQEVSITLSAIAVDDTGENYALWVDPRIVNTIEN